MGNPFEITPERMREMGYQVIDALVDYWQNLPESKIGARATRDELENLLRVVPPEQGEPFEAVLSQFLQEVLTRVIHVDHPRYFAFVPAPNNYVGVMADTLAAGTNIFAGTWMVGAGATQVELIVIDWLRQWLGMPETAGGLFVSGGSIANLVALTAARHATLGEELSLGTVYLSDQTHSCVARALRVLGFLPEQIVTMESDNQFKLSLSALKERVAQDRESGWTPAIVIASAGTTNTGAVDPLDELADFCAEQGLWLHIDGAYGAAAILSEKYKFLLKGIEKVHSLAIDPHKWFFQPMAAGCVIVRDFDKLKEAFHILPPYLQDKEQWGGSVDLCDYGIELSRGFRALKLWMSIKTFGAQAFRDAVDGSIGLAEYAEQILRGIPDWEIVSPATLGILAYRYAPPHLSAEEQDRLNRSLVEKMIEDGYAMISSTVLKGRVALRLCPLSPRATKTDIEETLRRLNAFATSA